MISPEDSATRIVTVLVDVDTGPHVYILKIDNTVADGVVQKLFNTKDIPINKVSIVSTTNRTNRTKIYINQDTYDKLLEEWDSVPF